MDSERRQNFSRFLGRPEYNIEDFLDIECNHCGGDFFLDEVFQTDR